MMKTARTPTRTLIPGEQGYTLVVLIIAITVLNILLAAMLPLASQAIRREKEEELVFRGLQYAEAIRMFQLRNQRFPNTLDELIKVKPRCIRQLWKDPMTEDGKWVLVFQNQDLPILVPQTQEPNGRERPEKPKGGENPEDPGDQKEPNDEPQDEKPAFGPRKGEVVQVGPIIGVHSKSNKKSILIWSGRERYDEWNFTVDLITSQRVQSGGAAVPTGGMSLSTRWIGRPMRFFGNQGGPPGGVQDGTMPDGTRPGTSKPTTRPNTQKSATDRPFQ